MSKPFVILSWIAGSGLTLCGLFYTGVKYVAWEQIKEDRATKADTAILFELKEIKSVVGTMQTDFANTKSNVNVLTGSYNALDRSYVRILEKTLKATEESSQYKDEKIQALQEALKKNDLQIP
jgi:hypothetical protein